MRRSVAAASSRLISSVLRRAGAGAALLVASAALACASGVGATTATASEDAPCALAGLYVQRHVDAAMVPVQGSSTQNTYGDGVVEEALPEATRRLEQALGCRFLPIEQVVSRAEYARVPQAREPERWTATRGLRPVSVDGSADAALGELARALGAREVVVVRAAFALQLSADDDVGSNRQFGAADFRAYAVSPDGQRTWESQQIAETPPQAFTLGDVPAELQMEALEKEAKRLGKGALYAGIAGIPSTRQAR